MGPTNTSSIDVSSIRPMVRAEALVAVEGTLPDRAKFETAASDHLEPLWRNHLCSASGTETVQCPTSVAFEYLPLVVPAAEAGFYTVACPKITVTATLCVDDISPTGFRRAAIRAANSAHKRRRKLAKAIAAATGLLGMPAKRVAVELTIRTSAASNDEPYDEPF